MKHVAILLIYRVVSFGMIHLDIWSALWQRDIAYSIEGSRVGSMPSMYEGHEGDQYGKSRERKKIATGNMIGEVTAGRRLGKDLGLFKGFEKSSMNFIHSLISDFKLYSQ